LLGHVVDSPSQLHSTITVLRKYSLPLTQRPSRTPQLTHQP